MKKIIDIEGVGEVYARSFRTRASRPWRNSRSRAQRQGTRSDRREDWHFRSVILRWVNHADLIRIVGVAEQYAELLEASGVDSIPELSHRVAENLYAKMVEVNEKKNLVGRLPSVGQISAWIDQCKNLPRAVFH